MKQSCGFFFPLITEQQLIQIIWRKAGSQLKEIKKYNESFEKYSSHNFRLLANKVCKIKLSFIMWRHLPEKTALWAYIHWGFFCLVFLNTLSRQCRKPGPCHIVWSWSGYSHNAMHSACAQQRELHHKIGVKESWLWKKVWKERVN